MRFSGMPQRPNPPSMMVAPEGMSATAASADGTTLFIRGGLSRIAGGVGLAPAGSGLGTNLRRMALVDGLLPTALFGSLYVNNQERFVVFNPRVKRDAHSTGGSLGSMASVRH